MKPQLGGFISNKHYETCVVQPTFKHSSNNIVFLMKEEGALILESLGFMKYGRPLNKNQGLDCNWLDDVQHLENHDPSYRYALVIML